MDQRLLYLRNIKPDELAYLENLTAGLSDDKMNLFVALYGNKRKTEDTVLICTLLGFVGFSGVQRFILGQIGMGILFFFTAGLCFIGTIVDLINHKEMTYQYNCQQAMETIAMIR